MVVPVLEVASHHFDNIATKNTSNHQVAVMFFEGCRFGMCSQGSFFPVLPQGKAQLFSWMKEGSFPGAFSCCLSPSLDDGPLHGFPQ